MFIMNIYASSDDPIEGISAEELTEKIKRYGHKDVSYIGPIESATEKICSLLKPGDLVITLGAGSITRLSEEILECIKNGKTKN